MQQNRLLVEGRGTGHGQERRGWTVVVAYALVCAAIQLLWLTYAAITTDSAHRYGVSKDAIGWLAEIFPLLYVVLAIPAGIALDRAFRSTLAFGTALVVLGALIRLTDLSFAAALAGQALVALAQPIVQSAVGKVAVVYVRPARQADAITVGAAGGFVGMVLSLLLGPALGRHGHLERLLAVEAALAIAPSLWLLTLLRRPAGALQTRSAQPAATEPTADVHAARELLSLAPMRLLCGLAFVGFGTFVASATWLQSLLEPDGISESTSGALLVAMVLVGVLGCAILPPLVERRRAQRGALLAAAVAGVLGNLLLGTFSGVAARGVTLAAIGFVVLPALPVILTEAERLAGAAAGTAGALIWMMGNLGGVIVALLVGALVDSPFAAFTVMAAVSVAGIPLALRVRSVTPSPELRA